jgi:hypothetical protein
MGRYEHKDFTSIERNTLRLVWVYEVLIESCVLRYGSHNEGITS